MSFKSARLLAALTLCGLPLSSFATDSEELDIKSEFRTGSAELVSVSDFHPNYPPTNLFDHDISTLYRSESINPAVLEIEFQQAIEISGIHLFPSNAWGEPAYRWRVEGSNSANPVVYEILVDWTNSASEQWSEVILDQAASIRNLRLTVERLTGDDFVHITQLRLFSSAGEEIRVFADRFEPKPVACILTKPSQMLLVHVGEKAECQDESVDEAVEFLSLYSGLDLSWREQNHPFVMPPERWGGIWLKAWDLDQTTLPFYFNTITTLWQCDRDDPDLEVWAAGSAIGADFGVRGAALASVVMHGCGVWWTCIPQHGFENWAAQITVHEIRNTIYWWYHTECVDAGAPSLLGPYDDVEPGKNYCSQFDNLHDCYIAWFEDMNRGLKGEAPLYPK